MLNPSLLHKRDSPRLENVRCRADLGRAQRVVIKAGTSTIVDADGYPSLRRISQIAEDICAIRRTGREVIFVSSGAVGVGRNTLRRQAILGSSAFDRLHRTEEQLPMGANVLAAAGSASLMTLYQTLFSQLDTTVSELLLTKHDFDIPDRKENLANALDSLLLHGIVPIVNENDAVTAGSRRSGDPFNDNDGLAALVAAQMNADVLVLLTDVDGLYDRPPSEPAAQLISTFPGEASIQFGAKSSVGRGGMEAKIDAARRALDWGVPAVVVTSGAKPNAITQVFEGKRVGTLFVEDPAPVIAAEMADNVGPAVAEQARACRDGSRALVNLTSDERQTVLHAVADALDANRDAILAANQADLEREKMRQLAGPLMKRLQLTSAKIDTLVAGIKSLAAQDEPIGKVLSKMELSEGVVLTKESVPIGVLMVIFESRPDSLPQIAALALRSGNGLLLKGGREAEKSNAMLHKVIVEAVEAATGGRVNKGVIGLVTSRAEIGALLALDKEIDLVIPRGSNALVSHIQKNTNIPVLGHADGVCHAYVHPSADLELAKKVLIDAKINYPAACNAVETILLDGAIADDDIHAIAGALRGAGVVLRGGKRAVAMGLCDTLAKDFHEEYGDNTCTIELIDGVDEAVAHINEHGSHHTETILSADDHPDAARFLKNVDSACVFHNASTRMADGYRLGLGAEVGISTGRIHARGPVGVEGLMAQKWVLRSRDGVETTAEAYAKGASIFTHKALPL